MSWCCYQECPNDCNETDCNCPCHQDRLEDAHSAHSGDWDHEEMQGMCPHETCRKDCCGHGEDCSCPCHQDELEALSFAEYESDALAAEEGISTDDGNSSDGQSK